MWDLTVSVPDHCLFLYRVLLRLSLTCVTYSSSGSHPGMTRVNRGSGS